MLSTASDHAQPATGRHGNAPQPAESPPTHLLSRDALEFLRARLGGYPRSEQVLRHWRCAGTGPAFVKINGRILYPLSALEAFIAGQKEVRSTTAARLAREGARR